MTTPKTTPDPTLFERPEASDPHAAIDWICQLLDAEREVHRLRALMRDTYPAQVEAKKMPQAIATERIAQLDWLLAEIARAKARYCRGVH